MIYAFEYPHQVGTICGPGCPICDPRGPNPDLWMTDEHGAKFPIQPLFIIRKATYGEYVNGLRGAGGSAPPATTGYYYEVSTD